MNGTRKTVLERFESYFTRTSPDDCWEWSGDSTTEGHGRFALSSARSGRKRIMASQFALLLAADYPGDKTLLACHHCDNPPCVNPNHLYWGTHQDNVRDAETRNRRANASAMRKHLTLREREDIKLRHSTGETIVSISSHYSINRLTARRIINGTSWKVSPTEEMGNE